MQIHNNVVYIHKKFKNNFKNCIGSNENKSIMNKKPLIVRADAGFCAN